MGKYHGMKTFPPVIFQGMEVGLKMFRWVISDADPVLGSGITQVESEGVGLQMRFGRLMGPPRTRPAAGTSLSDRSGPAVPTKQEGEVVIEDLWRKVSGEGRGQNRSHGGRLLPDRRPEHRPGTHRRQVPYRRSDPLPTLVRSLPSNCCRTSCWRPQTRRRPVGRGRCAASAATAGDLPRATESLAEIRARRAQHDWIL